MFDRVLNTPLPFTKFYGLTVCILERGCATGMTPQQSISHTILINDMSSLISPKGNPKLWVHFVRDAKVCYPRDFFKSIKVQLSAHFKYSI